MNLRKSKGSRVIEKVVEKPWGFERWFAEVPDGYLGKKLIISGGQTTSYHHHEKKEETLLVVKGVCHLETDSGVFTYVAGESFHIFPLENHRMFSREGEVVLIEVSTYFPDDTVRVKDFYNR